MRKLYVVVLFLICSLYAFPSEKKAALGLGLEWNMNSPHNFAAGAALGFDYNLTNKIAVGLNLGGSTNFIAAKAIEPYLLFRNYFLENNFGKFFGQADVGAFLIFEDGYDMYPMALVGLRLGLRKPLGSLFYIEPHGRLGYPFVFGIGLMAGINF